MAKKSEELLENSASLPNSKPNLKISRKTKSSPVSEPVTTDTISVDSISNAQKTQKETKQKRTIRININKSQNETKAVEFTLGFDAFKLLNQDYEWVVEPGNFKIHAAASSRDIRLTAEIEL